VRKEIYHDTKLLQVKPSSNLGKKKPQTLSHRLALVVLQFPCYSPQQRLFFTLLLCRAYLDLNSKVLNILEKSDT
jgi:hypothetical protein